MDLSHSGNTAHQGRATEPSRHPLPRPPTASPISPACGSACEPPPAPAGPGDGPPPGRLHATGGKDPAPAPSGRGALQETAGAISWRTGPQDVRRMSSRTGCSSVRRSRSGADAHPVRRIRSTPPDFLRSTPAPYGVPAGVAGLFHRPLGPQLVRSRHARLQPPELAR